MVQVFTNDMYEEFRSRFNIALRAGDRMSARAVIAEVDQIDNPEAVFMGHLMSGVMIGIDGDVQGALAHHMLTLEMALQHGLTHRLAAVYRVIASGHRQLRQFREATMFISKALKAAEDSNSELDVGHILNEEAAMLQQQDRVQQSIESAQRALEIAQRYGDTFLQITVLGTLGTSYSMIGEIASSVTYLNRQLSLAEEHGNVEAAMIAESNLGNSYALIGDNIAAIEYYLRASDKASQLGSHAMVVGCLANIGGSYEELGDSAAGIVYYDQAIDLCNQHHLPHPLGHLLGNRAVCKMSLGQIDDGLVDLYQAERLSLASDDHRAVIMVRVNILECFIAKEDWEAASQLLTSLQQDTISDVKLRYDVHNSAADLMMHDGRVDEAIAFLNDKVQEATDLGFKTAVARIYSYLRKAYRLKGDLEGYIKATDLYLAETEEVRGGDQQRRLAVNEKRRELFERDKELERHKTALYSTLPKPVADRVLAGERVSDQIDDASILFLDIVDFTRISSNVPAGHVVHLLDAIFGACDDIIHKHQMTKVKTIGDAYLAVAGVIHKDADHAARAARAAVEMLKALDSLEVTMPPEMGDTSWTTSIPELKVRIGLHCGPVVAGIVGRDRLQFDVWGDTVNVASRMESTGEPGRIQASDEFAIKLRHAAPSPELPKLEPRGLIEVKGKGQMMTYWVV